MNSYVDMQIAFVAARQAALRTEAAADRLLASASPLPAVSVGSRAAGFDAQAANTTRHHGGEPVAVGRSLGAAALDERTSAHDVRRADKPCECGEGAAAA